MARPLGRQQLAALSAIASPSSMLLTQDRQSRSLVRRGLAREERAGGACCITPAGLRALADALEAGRIQDAIALATARRERAH